MRFDYKVTYDFMKERGMLRGDATRADVENFSFLMALCSDYNIDKLFGMFMDKVELKNLKKVHEEFLKYYSKSDYDYNVCLFDLLFKKSFKWRRELKKCANPNRLVGCGGSKTFYAQFKRQKICEECLRAYGDTSVECRVCGNKFIPGLGVTVCDKCRDEFIEVGLMFTQAEKAKEQIFE